MRVTVYLADVSRLDIPRALGAVTGARREKALRLRTDDAKRRSLGAALLTYKAVNGGVPFDPLYGDCGKPYFPDGPGFSVSHSGKFAACAVAERDVGLDIETLRPINRAAAQRYFTPEERSLLHTDEDFTRLWIKRESLGKLVGCGILPLPGDAGERFTTELLRCGELFIAVSTELGFPPEPVLLWDGLRDF